MWDLIEAYKDVNKRVLQSPNLRVNYNLDYLTRWRLWDVWSASGYGNQKIPVLQGLYIDFNHLQAVRDQLTERWGSSRDFALTFLFGNTLPSNPHIIKLVGELKQQPSSSCPRALAIRRELRELGHSGGTIDAKMHKTGLCLVALVLRVSRDETVPLIVFRTVETVRRLQADLGMIDNVLRFILGKWYTTVNKVEMNFGLAWMPHYHIPLIVAMIPELAAFTDKTIKISDTSYKAVRKAKDLTVKFCTNPLLYRGLIQPPYKLYRPKDFIIRGKKTLNRAICPTRKH